MDEELTNENAPPEQPEGVEAPKSKKKMLLLIGLFVGLFIVTGIGNYLFLKTTYIPPEPPVEAQKSAPEKKPIMKIDLGVAAPEDNYYPPDSTVKMPITATIQLDSVRKAHDDSIHSAEVGRLNNVIGELRSQIKQGDSLLVATRQELVGVKSDQEVNQAVPDSLSLKKSHKLAKIVENMPAEEAAKMLQPLDDEMVIDILLRLKQRQAAQIMAALPTTRSARISETIMKPIVQR